ncbi:MAG TPA: hypothetical protein VFY73_05630 [Ideonella sp.]|uniref:hypothetical protein n=1 Tax=Ideonella sp. TaxID=1929293 RepID=UPI002E347A6C|nr:hypothetical protein [Ideonella sp.]HEX5683500.1 hypothetical protein [Ideonella sp.]
MSYVAKLSLAAVAAAFAFSAFAGGEPPGVHSAKKMSAEAISTPHALKKTYFDTDSASVAINPGFNVVGTTLTLNCGNAAGCTIAANMNAQLAAVATENNAAVCLMIDGSYINCPFNGIIRAGGGYQVMNYQTFASVAQGSHTVEMHVYSGQATTMFRWNKEIKLYNP